MRNFNVASLEIQTAGSGGGPEATLVAVRDPEGVRELIMHHRDQLVFAHGLQTGGGTDGGKGAAGARAAPELASSALVAEIREIKESVLRMEAIAKKY